MCIDLHFSLHWNAKEHYFFVTNEKNFHHIEKTNISPSDVPPRCGEVPMHLVLAHMCKHIILALDIVKDLQQGFLVPCNSPIVHQFRPNSLKTLYKCPMDVVEYGVVALTFIVHMIDHIIESNKETRIH